MSAHTRGPWEIDRHLHGSEGAIWGPDGMEVCRVTDRGGERRDNARLIAAAPDSYAANVAMLAALEEAFGIKAAHDDDWIYDALPSSNIASAYFMAREAVAKAKGETA